MELEGTMLEMEMKRQQEEREREERQKREDREFQLRVLQMLSGQSMFPGYHSNTGAAGSGQSYNMYDDYNYVNVLQTTIVLH